MRNRSGSVRATSLHSRPSIAGLDQRVRRLYSINPLSFSHRRHTAEYQRVVSLHVNTLFFYSRIPSTRFTSCFGQLLSQWLDISTDGIFTIAINYKWSSIYSAHAIDFADSTSLWLRATSRSADVRPVTASVHSTTPMPPRQSSIWPSHRDIRISNVSLGTDPRRLLDLL